MHFQTVISSAEGAEDGVAKFTSLVRATHEIDHYVTLVKEK